MKAYDVIVLGLGAVGSAASYQLAKRGKRVLGIDQLTPPHSFGSSHGESRIIRPGTGEGEQYVPLGLRSYEIFREIEKETGQSLIALTGGLYIESLSEIGSEEKDSVLFKSVEGAKKYGIDYELLETKEFQRRFPQFKVTDQFAYFEPIAGYARPEIVVASQIKLAEKYGSVIRTNEKVLEIMTNEAKGKISIKTAQGIHEAEYLILACGPWVTKFLEPQYSQLFKPYRQRMLWFKVEKDFLPLYEPDKCPVYDWIWGKDRSRGVYGFPVLDGQTIKIGSEKDATLIDPDKVDRSITPEDIAEIFKEGVAERLNGISNEFARYVTCMYTETPTMDFVIDFHPDQAQIIVASPCSGHGFKHSPAVGEVLAQLACDGKSKFDISTFSFERLLSAGGLTIV